MYKSTGFIFDGVSSETYGLMIYFLDDQTEREISLGTDVEVIEDRLPKRINPIHYGVDINKSMSFPLTFGSTEYLEDYDVDAILSWLTGHQQYKWLEFLDGDHYVRYKCHLNNMTSIYINGLPVAFSCDVECDGQFAYEYPREYSYDISETETYIEFFNKSSYNGYLYPQLKLEFADDCSSFSIINESDNNREFKIDCFDRVVTNTSANEYRYESTIAEETLDVDVNTELISWQVKELTATDIYSEIIKGEIDEVEIWIALPQNSNKALYSEDKGESWHEASPALPHVGNWTGCFGESGFVAICTDNDQAIATYSQTGKGWTSTIIELPISQKWQKVVFVETDGFMQNQYIAMGGSDSSIIATSATGWAWQIISLPVAQEWRSAVAGNNKILLVGGNSNIAVMSTDCIHWEEITLPKNAAWSAGAYGPNGFVIVADTLYGSGSKEPIALRSIDGYFWDVIDFPIGSWSDMTFGNSMYMAVGERQFIYSFDGEIWTSNTLPANSNHIIFQGDYFICPIALNKYLISDSAATIAGEFEIIVPADPAFTVSDVYVSAVIGNTISDTSYISNGTKLLATNTDSGEITGGEFVAITTDLRYGQDISGIMMSATFDKDTKTVTVKYTADSNHTSAINAPLSVIVEYKTSSTTDLGYDGLVVNFDNSNQIITTNKETLNMYEYFNKRFLRLVKGLNKLKIKTDGGNCKAIIICEFLRKVGGR